MNIINLENISKIFGEKIIFDNASLGIHSNDKIGIVGVNGTGKSTLLRVIAGVEELDSGKIISSNNLHMTYLTQLSDLTGQMSILDYCLEQDYAKTDEYNTWVNPTDAKIMLQRLGIFDFEQAVETLSGGQKKRVALAKTLLHPTDVLLLDEPTNHLDSQMIEWLEQYLQGFRGCILLVTHDRYFLDNVTNKIIEIDQGNIYSYDSNYEGYLSLKCEREEMALSTDDKRRNLLRNELKWVMRGAQARSTKQKARLQRFEELKNTKAPVKRESVEMESMASRLGKKTIEIHNISKKYQDKSIIQGFDYNFLRNERVGIVGVNGCGKSTLLKLIVGELLPDEGYIEYGETIRIGYLGQEPESIAPNIRVIDSVKDIAEYLPTSTGRITASKMCERFLFTPDMQYTLVGKLSGGERRRLYLLHVLMSSPNVLILDEPTNDLDIETLNVLEDYLDHFDGIVVVVSHDRYFLDRIVGRIFAFENDGLRQYEGGYTEYYWKHKELYGDFLSLEDNIKSNISASSSASNMINDKNNKNESSNSNEDSKLAWKQHTQKLKFSFKEQKEFETIDDDIAKLEAKIQELDSLILKSSTDFVALNQYSTEKEVAEQELNDKMERWVYLNDLAEQIENQNK